ncbi:hypothetical protein [Acidiferrobacter thiooxydans]|uniref:Uncharacterized protein n=1 Tax=Acidiferrobacter thiooxydans TaxID=163359 RepID=A0A368HB78_9GAMM|nr:hypothetical protein [Acidiferrobacter thiooxydans]RCN55696.1 hypothetical protein C4900_07125 [Acidiferrobacter thiooxydans]
MQRFDLLLGEHLGGRPIRVRAGQVGHMHQAHADDAEKRQIALEAQGLLEQAVLDLAAGFEHLMPDLDAPAPPIPPHLLGGGREVFDDEIVSNTQLIGSTRPAGTTRSPRSG